MSGRPALVTRYSVALTAAHFPVGDETYDILTLEAGEIYDGDLTVIDSTLDGDPPTLSITDGVVTVTGAGDPAGASTTGVVTVSVVILEPGLEVTIPTPDEP